MVLPQKFYYLAVYNLAAGSSCLSLLCHNHIHISKDQFLQIFCDYQKLRLVTADCHLETNSTNSKLSISNRLEWQVLMIRVLSQIRKHSVSIQYICKKENILLKLAHFINRLTFSFTSFLVDFIPHLCSLVINDQECPDQNRNKGNTGQMCKPH